MAERSEPTAASFASSRRSCACGDVDLADDASLVVRSDDPALIHAATACLRPY